MSDYSYYSGLGGGQQQPYTGPGQAPQSMGMARPAAPTGLAPLPAYGAQATPNAPLNGSGMNGLPEWGQKYENAFRPNSGPMASQNFDANYGTQIGQIQKQQGQNFVPYYAQQGMTPGQNGFDPFHQNIQKDQGSWDPNGTYRAAGSWNPFTGQAMNGGGVYAMPDFNGGVLNPKWNIPNDVIDSSGNINHAQVQMNHDLMGYYNTIAPYIPGITYQQVVDMYNNRVRTGNINTYTPQVNDPTYQYQT